MPRSSCSPGARMTDPQQQRCRHRRLPPTRPTPCTSGADGLAHGPCCRVAAEVHGIEKRAAAEGAVAGCVQERVGEEDGWQQERH
jgi:hypothetical protein